MKKLGILLAVLAVLSGYITLETKISRKAEVADMNVELDDLREEMQLIRNEIGKIPVTAFEKRIKLIEGEISVCKDNSSWSNKRNCLGKIIMGKFNLIKDISIFITKQKMTTKSE